MCMEEAYKGYNGPDIDQDLIKASRPVLRVTSQGRFLLFKKTTFFQAGRPSGALPCRGPKYQENYLSELVSYRHGQMKR